MNSKQISGVGHGKALKFGGPFLELIKKYVEDNDIERPIDLIIKTQANKSQMKVSIIQNIDRKIGLEDIAKSKRITYDDILKEIEAIVNSGTKLNLRLFRWWADWGRTSGGSVWLFPVSEKAIL